MLVLSEDRGMMQSSHKRGAGLWTKFRTDTSISESLKKRRGALRNALETVATVLAVAILVLARVSPENAINPDGIVIHHSAFSAEDIAQFPGPIDASVIDALHERRGFGVICDGRTYHIAYHYVILPDGTVQSGRPEHCVGAHTLGRNNALGICLVGNFSTRANPDGRLGSERPTKAQIRSLVSLVTALKGKYLIPCDQIQRHQDLNPRTLCPGDRLPWTEIQTQIGCGTAGK